MASLQGVSLKSGQVFSWLKEFVFEEHNRFFCGVGAVTVTYTSWSLLRSLWRGFRNYFLSVPFNLSADFKKYGEWAVVTGATDGIGKAYAQQLAKRGLNVVLLSRSEDKLKRVASEIEAGYKVKTKIITVDFSNGAEIYAAISDKLQGLDIGTLVNNVGIFSGLEYFHLMKNKDQIIPKMVNVNCLSCAMMTSIVLPLMVEKKKGIILNVSALAGMITPLPYATLYSATKAYMDFFSRGIQAEHASDGIIVQSLLPGMVSTNMSKNVKPSFFGPSTDKYVSQALGTVGLEERTTGCLAHDIKGWFWSTFGKQLVAVRARQLKAMLETQEKLQNKM